MKKKILAFTLAIMAKSAFAFDATSKTISSLAVEVVFSTAISSVTSEISSFAVSDLQKKEARRIQAEVQDYNQTGAITLFLGEKISILQNIDSSLSNDESVDVLVAASEFILSH
jgi:hypothetical protein